MLTSLNKAISNSGYCSRRQADEYIEQGRVTINGEEARQGLRVADTDVIRVDGELIKRNKVVTTYIALNKPKGIVCTTDTREPNNIIDFVRFKTRIFPIGRLDKLSDGLIFLTNDGDIVNKILRAGNNHEKEYLVRVDKPIEPAFIERMRNGVRIMGKVTKKCIVKHEGPDRFRIILTQGMNRQIRRMCEALGYKVITLTRTRIMTFTLSGIAPGKWRYFTPAEVQTMHTLLQGSSKTDVIQSDEGMGE